MYVVIASGRVITEQTPFSYLHLREESALSPPPCAWTGVQWQCRSRGMSEWPSQGRPSERMLESWNGRGDGDWEKEREREIAIRHRLFDATILLTVKAEGLPRVAAIECLHCHEKSYNNSPLSPCSFNFFGRYSDSFQEHIPGLLRRPSWVTPRSFQQQTDKSWPLPRHHSHRTSCDGKTLGKERESVYGTKRYQVRKRHWRVLRVRRWRARVWERERER